MTIVAIVVLVVAALISPAVGLVVIRRHWWWPAFIIGALTMFVITVLVGLVALGVAWAVSGPGVDPGPDCDDGIYCLTAGEEVLFAVYILPFLAVPIAAVGGFICALASLVLVRVTTDPVCGSSLQVRSTPLRSEFMDVTYPFCSMDCKEQFDADPVKYVRHRGRDRRRD